MAEVDQTSTIMRLAASKSWTRADIAQSQFLPQRHQEVVNVGLVADGRAMLVTDHGFLASHVVQTLFLGTLGPIVS